MTRSDSLQSFERSNTTATGLRAEQCCWHMYPTAGCFSRKIGAIFIITVYLTASANAVPEARSHSPTSSSQDLRPDSKPSAWSHQGFAGVMIFCIRAYCRFLSVWRVSTVYQSPCLSSVGFLHGSDQGSYTAFRYQGQRIIHLHAALQVCIAQRSHGCQGDRISLDFASVHHLVRNRTDEAHVYSEAESKVLALCIVSIERWRLAQASQVLEQLCIQRFGGHNRSQYP